MEQHWLQVDVLAPAGQFRLRRSRSQGRTHCLSIRRVLRLAVLRWRWAVRETSGDETMSDRLHAILVFLLVGGLILGPGQTAALVSPKADSEGTFRSFSSGLRPLPSLSKRSDALRNFSPSADPLKGVARVAKRRARSSSTTQDGVPQIVPNTGQSVTFLPNGGSLLLGGEGANGPIATAAIQDPQTGKVAPIKSQLREARAWHTATLLPDGTVLIFGGIGADGKIVNLAESFDPKTQLFHS